MNTIWENNLAQLFRKGTEGLADKTSACSMSSYCKKNRMFISSWHATFTYCSVSVRPQLNYYVVVWSLLTIKDTDPSIQNRKERSGNKQKFNEHDLLTEKKKEIFLKVFYQSKSVLKIKWVNSKKRANWIKHWDTSTLMFYDFWRNLMGVLEVTNTNLLSVVTWFFNYYLFFSSSLVKLSYTFD